MQCFWLHPEGTNTDCSSGVDTGSEKPRVARAHEGRARHALGTVALQ